MLTILFVGTLPPHPGGSAISAAGLLEGMAARGHRVVAVAPLAPAGGGPVFGEGVPGLGVTRVPVPFYDIDPTDPGRDDYRETLRARLGDLLPRLIAEHRPEVLFVGRETLAWDAIRIGEAHGLRTLLRLPGGTIIGMVEGLYPPAIRDGLVAEMRRASVVVAPGHDLARRAATLGLAATVIPNAVDLRRFAPRPRSARLLERLAIRPDQVVVAHVSNLKALKRPLDFLRAGRAALDVEPDLALLVVGDGPLRPQLEAEGRDLGPSAPRFAGWVGYPDMPECLSLADVVVLPSAGEGLARVYLETQACGRVLAASDIPPAREVVEDGVTGLLFPVGDTDALARVLVRVARDPGLRRRLGDAGRQQVLLRHDLDAAVDRYLALLHALAGQAWRPGRGRRRRGP